MTALGCCCSDAPLRNPLLAKLCADHDKILSLSSQVVARTAGPSPPGPTPLDRMLALQAAGALRSLACAHHDLEEAKFLPWIAKLDWPTDATEFVTEHRAGEDLLDSLVVSLRRGDMATASSQARTLDSALRGHIAHEGRIFQQLDRGTT